MTRSEILAAFRALPLHRRYEAMRTACADALDAWERYAKQGTVEYTDGVAGVHHVVDLSLPSRAIAAVDKHLAGEQLDSADIWEGYREPITAMQDDDLDFPDGIALAYYAIYNLFGVVSGCTKLYDQGETVVLQALRTDDAIAEWWTRTWDAWASRTDATYAPSELDALTFEALFEGELATAIDRCAKGTRLHAVLLWLAQRETEALAVTRALGLHGVPIDKLGPSDALVVGTRFYAAFFGSRYIVRSVHHTNAKRMSGTCAFTIRRVAISPALVLFAGDKSDDIGVYKTLVIGEELEGNDYGYKTEYAGTRTLAALGPAAELVPVSDRIVGILTRTGMNRFAEGRVHGAVIDADLLVTWAGRSFAIYKRSTRKRIAARELEGDIWAAIIDDQRVVFAVRGRAPHVCPIK